MKDKAYWEKFYETFERNEPSPFAEWARPRITGTRVYDIGCGNGRDTAYLEAIGVDPMSPQGANFSHLTAETFFECWESFPSDTVYARWFLHAVEERVEDELLEWTQGQLFVEARAIGDELDGSHYRRPINPEVFLQKLLDFDYEIIYYELGRSFSYETPLLFRVEAYRKH
jgi:hypothetical protein